MEVIMSLVVGSITKIINCKIGDFLQGQLYPRKAEYIYDDLEANSFYISNGKESVLIISCDLVSLKRNFIKEVVQLINLKTKIPEENVLICCTHTHTGPAVSGYLFDMPINESYLKDLKGWLIELSQETIKSAKPARVGYALGKVHIGYNRRVCWDDGTHTMYGDTKKIGFIGLEGPDDPSHVVLIAKDNKDNIISIIHNNTCHSTCLEHGNFVSADYPGSARAKIRNLLNIKLPILYLQGACGDVSPFNLLLPDIKIDEEYRKKRNEEIGLLLSEETLRLIKNIKMLNNCEIQTKSEELKIPIRLPTEEMLKKAKEVIKEGLEKAGRWNYVLEWTVLKLHNEYKDSPFEMVPIHAVRIGEIAIVTNPCEYYCQFGLDIKRRSPAKITMVVELTNGSSGYCRTTYVIIGGGYSGSTNYGSRLETYAGYRIVDISSKLLYQLWRT